MHIESLPKPVRFVLAETRKRAAIYINSISINALEQEKSIALAWLASIPDSRAALT